MGKYYVADTNVLLDSIEQLQGYKVVLLSHTLRELEKHKSSRNFQLAYKARKASRFIKENIEQFYFDSKDYDGSLLGSDYSKDYEDNNIIRACVEKGYGLITKDVLLQFKAKSFGIEMIDLNADLDTGYKGYKEIHLDTTKDDDNRILASLYENPENNTYNLLTNEYLIVWDLSKPTYKNGVKVGYEPIDKFKFNGHKLTKLNYKKLNNTFTGKVKPINVKQEIAFDMLQDNNIKVKSLFGNFGTGKDFLMITHAVDMLLDKSNKIDKIVWVRNNIQVADTNDIGFLPDSLEDKLKPFLAPLLDHIGGDEGLSFLGNKVEVQHLGFVRGRDIKNAIVYVTECQANTEDHVKLLLGRVGEGSMIFFNGDTRQVDADKFKYNNGVLTLKKLAGNPLYGQVELDKVERSEVARLADLL